MSRFIRMITHKLVWKQTDRQTRTLVSIQFAVRRKNLLLQYVLKVLCVFPLKYINKIRENTCRSQEKVF